MIDIEQIKLIDLIPPNLQSDDKVRAAAEALDAELKKVTQLIPATALLHMIDTLPERWVDELAWQWHVDFYDPTLDLKIRRELVKNSFRWHKRKGTPSAVTELIATVFGSGDVVEWYEYGGQPGYFRVVTSDPAATTERAQQFLDAINSVKNARSWLESIQITTEATMPLYFGGMVHTGDYIIIEQGV